MQDFAGKVAVVTGAASGIGRAMTLRLRDEGMRLVLGDIDSTALDAFVAELVASGGEAVGLRTDVSQRADVEALAAVAVEAFGSVHLVCNNAGVHGPYGEPVWQTSDADLQRVLGVNLWGVVHGVSVFLPMLIEQEGETHIVNTASASGLVAGATVYNVSKHAVISYSEAVYSDLHETGSRVGISVLLPGFANTALLAPPSEPETSRRRRKKGIVQLLARSSLQLSMPPEQVVDRMIEGVRANQFYILADHEWDGLILERANDAVSGHNPTIADGLSMHSRWPWARPKRPT